MSETYGFTRRGLLMVAAGASAQPWFRLYAGNSDFWNKKEPAEWSSEEIDKLLTKSPWAKEVTASSAAMSRPYGGASPGDPGVGGGGGYPAGGGGYPGGGGMGGGGRGMGGGRRGGGQGGPMPISYKATVRWESAKPIVEALKNPLPEEFANAYVISVSGVPILRQGRQHSDDGDSGTTVSQGLTDELLDRIKNLTYLEPKGKAPAQPSAVKKGAITSSGPPTLLFGFPRDVVPLTEDDREVTFTTELGQLPVKTKFNLKDMMYHKELAL
ncbi:MAG TPA: hypothetical protein VKR61_12945 [Bryobacteraceae bacterium]|nr:hypothetical protein [Bryobacteraceae bacterium]